MPVLVTSTPSPAVTLVLTAALVSTAFNWLTLTASVSSVPAATLVILFLPLSKPAAVNLTSEVVPPTGALITTPALLTKVSPALTLSTTKSFLVATVISLPLRVMAMFSPFRNCTVSLALTAVAVSPLACSLKV